MMDRTERIAAVRSFNRFWIRRIGALQPGLVDTAFTLTEARVIFELAQRPVTPMGELRERLGLDAGYLSRMVSKLREQGILTTGVSPDDARRLMVQLTDAGYRAYETIDERSNAKVGEVLDGHSPYQQVRLVNAMADIERIVEEAATPELAFRTPRAGDFGWVIQRHGELYASEQGWGVTFEAMVARIVADYVSGHDPLTERAWIAEFDGQRVGSAFCVRKDATTAQLRLLLVEPSARGLGIGRRLMDECVSFAKSSRYAGMHLRTSETLTAAQRLYEAAGFRLLDEAPDHNFEGAPPAQTWALDL